MQEIQLSDEQQKLFEYIESAEANIFVTGRAGTGKSTLLNYLISQTKKKVVVCAPTGVAALNVGGTTIHSLFGFPIGVLGTQDIRRHMNSRVREVLKAIDVLVIDEVSMVNADMMDAISTALGIAKGRAKQPFGGAQVVMFGDPYQLAPVPGREAEELAHMAENYQSHWFFDAHVWRETALERFELTEIFRQSDEEFKDILNSIREGRCTQEMLDYLNQRGNRFPPHPDVIRLATINAAVDRVNRHRIDQIATPVTEFHAVFSDDDAKHFGKNLPAEPVLQLKVGAQVMFIKNDEVKRTTAGAGVRRWVNGTIGTVVKLPKQGGVIVEVDGEELEVEPATWQKVRYELKSEFDEASGRFKDVLEAVPLAEFQQIPLRLAWAVTIHKSQGQTYDEVVIDLGGGAFSAGQTYVALSRVRSLEGMYLTRAITMRDIMVDDNVIRFMAGSKQWSSSAPEAMF